MKALILCAGYGKRLRPITNKIPKPLVRVGGVPVLSHIIEHILYFGIRKIIVNVHYKPEAFFNYYRNLLYFYEPELLGEEGTINSLEPWLKEDYTLVMNGDTITDIDINRMFRFSEGKNIRSMDYRLQNIYTGCKILSPDYFNGNKNFTEYFDKEMTWIDIGTPKGLKEAKLKYEKLNRVRKVFN
jgi:NDP-sugar pyrophosphorylase family protein